MPPANPDTDDPLVLIQLMGWCVLFIVVVCLVLIFRLPALAYRTLRDFTHQLGRVQ